MAEDEGPCIMCGEPTKLSRFGYYHCMRHRNVHPDIMKAWKLNNYGLKIAVVTRNTEEIVAGFTSRELADRFLEWVK